MYGATDKLQSIRRVHWPKYFRLFLYFPHFLKHALRVVQNKVGLPNGVFAVLENVSFSTPLNSQKMSTQVQLLLAFRHILF